MSQLAQAIPELRMLGSTRALVRIPCEQDVPFTPRVRALVDTPEFQRLRAISQLGLAALVYPGATHSRFEHALGVFRNALRYVAQLAEDSRFCELVDVHRAEVFLAAALLHDLGHWPFCHPIEDMALPGLPPHESHAAAFLSERRELAQVLRSEWNVDPQEILTLLCGRPDEPHWKLLQSLLSGPIDVDKMDYLERDSLHAGVPYGRNFDKNRLIQSLMLNAAGDGLAINSKGKTAAEMMVFARYVMFSEVYWHHAVRAATAMFARGFFEVYQRLDLPELFQGTEAEVVHTLRDAAAGTPAEILLEGVFGPRRRLYKRVAEYTQFQNREMYERLAGRPFEETVQCARRLIEGLSTHLRRPIGPTDVLIDAPPPHREVQFRVDVYYEKERRYRPLRTVSPVVEALATRQFDDYVKRVRVFATPELAESLRRCPAFDALLKDAAG
ncbi:MAG: HD domain-containing protein [Planctomycetota bacterium]|nr:MAG: HD domain-containing protein [Planctomycetota bacterium]